MKKQFYLLFTGLLFLIMAAEAQPAKGDIFLGGCFSAKYSDNKEDGMRTDVRGGFSIAPQAGIFLDKGFYVGGGFEYSNDFRTSYSTYMGLKTTRETTHSVGFSFLAGKYTRLTNNFYCGVLGEMGYGVDLVREKDFQYNLKSDIQPTHNFDIRVRPALTYFPKPNIGLQFSYGQIGYNLSATESGDLGPKSVSNNFKVKLGLDGLRVGLLWLLNKPKEAA